MNPLSRLLQRRRERESAVAAGEVEEIARELAGPADRESFTKTESEPEAETSEGPDATLLPGASPSELGAMIGRAISSGHAQVSTASHRVDDNDGGLADEITGLLAAALGHQPPPTAPDPTDHDGTEADSTAP